jgi:hypothetical protein
MKKLILSLALSAFAFSLVAAPVDTTQEKLCPMKDKTNCPMKDKACPADKEAQAGCCKSKAAAKDAQGGCCKDKAPVAKPADKP